MAPHCCGYKRLLFFVALILRQNVGKGVHHSYRHIDAPEEDTMAKGQQRSNREKKKPKKSAAEKPKGGSSFAQPQIKKGR